MPTLEEKSQQRNSYGTTVTALGFSDGENPQEDVHSLLVAVAGLAMLYPEVRTWS